MKTVHISGFHHFAKVEVKNDNRDLTELKYINFQEEQIENESFIFNVNRPFIFLIIHPETEIILFVGHIYTPQKN